jgi:hypothetical protein
MKKRLSLGDVFEIPLSDGRVAFGQYVHRDAKMGPLIQVYDLIIDAGYEPQSALQQLGESRALFPPVITGVFAAVKAGLWKIIGKMELGEFHYPEFVSVMHERYIPQSHWFLWNEQGWHRIGRELEDKHRHLEFLCVWDPNDIPHRIETGENPYREMIEGAIK